MRRFALVFALLLIAAAAAIGIHWRLASGAADKTAKAPPPVPVEVAAATQKDVPILLRGLGTVRGFNVVSITSRVEGNITKINFKEGQFVHAGDTLIELDPRPFQAALDQAKATLARDQASLENAKADLQRYSTLLQKQFAPEQQVATQQTLVNTSQAALGIDQALIEAAQLNLDYATLKSPVDGVTGIRQVDIGNLVQANSTQNLVLVTQVEPIYVQFTLPEADIGRVRAAMAKASLTVLAFDNADEHQLAEGKLELIDNNVDQTTGTVAFRARFENKSTELWPGQFVSAHLILEDVRKGVTVPSAAVQTGPNGRYVYVVGDNDVAQMRSVDVRQIENNVALIGSGLKTGERVVTMGQARLRPGLKVTVHEEASNVASSSESRAPNEMP
jgi:membrane fusion protein, multidrug efflux system